MPDIPINPISMEKSYSRILGLGLVMAVVVGASAPSFAQKPDNIGKDSKARTTTNELPAGATGPVPPPPMVGSGAPPNGSALPPTVGAAAPTENPVPAVQTAPPPAAQATGVQGTTELPNNTDDNGPLGNKPQVGGITNEPRSGGKRPGVPESLQTSLDSDVAGMSFDPKASCEDQGLAKIYELLLKDKSNVLGSLFELTSMRLARRALETDSDTLEQMARREVTDLEAKVEALKGSGEIQTGMKAIYETYGKKADIETINQDLTQSFGKAKEGCYWYKAERLMNDHASSFVLAVTTSEKDSGLSDIDAATIWAVEKIRTTAAAKNPAYRIGNAMGNLMNISTRTARYLGKIHGGKASGKEEIEKDIAAVQASLNGAIAEAYTKVKVALNECFKAKNANCTQCVTDAQSAFESKSMGFDKIQRGLLQAVSKSENLKMESGLVARMGNISLDLSGFAKGNVPPATTKGKEFADCMHARKSKARKGGKSARMPATTQKAAAPEKFEIVDQNNFMRKSGGGETQITEEQYYQKLNEAYKKSHNGESLPRNTKEQPQYRQGYKN